MRARYPPHPSGLIVLVCSTLAFGVVLSVAEGNDRATMATVAGADFATVLPPAPQIKVTHVDTFRLDRRPVTNEEFAQFVNGHQEWRRDRVPKLFADASYLSHWPSPAGPDKSQLQQPVTHVSWYAARAYCDARGARLPTWYEWEWAAAANDKLADARTDPKWRQQMLDWYARPASAGLPPVGTRPPNKYGVYDLHGLVWEWVEDYNSMLVSGDNREQSEPDATRFCGPGALTMEEKDNYAVLMRIAMLSSMHASYTTNTMGFRCAQ